MVTLPNEIIHQIIHEFNPYVGYGGHTGLVPLAAINRNWQTVAEDYIWRHLRIRPREIGCFRAAFSRNSSRKQALKTLDIRFEGYFIPKSLKKKEQNSRDEGNIDDESSNESDDAPWCEVCASGECAKDRTTFTGDRTVQADNGKSESPDMRLAAAQNEHARFFREVKAIWDELAGWKENLRVTSIDFHVTGFSVYKFLGPKVCSGECLNNNTLLDFSSLPELPLLPSVKFLWVREETNWEIDLWPAIATCRIASSLPMLERLEAVGVDYERGWPLARKGLRHALANQIAKLPASLRTLYLCLEYGGIDNHEVQPPNFLVGNLDWLSRSVRQVSIHLTTLAIRVSYISAALFWDPDTELSASSCAERWPNLRILDISTGLERPSGDYWLAPAANYPEHELYDWPDPGDLDSDSDDEDTERYRAVGVWPPRRFRTRPEPAFFDELAISIARAAAHMPKLEYLDLEFNASHQGLLEPNITSFHQGGGHQGGFRPSFHQYEGWTFYYRASNDARFASQYSKLYWFEHEPGLDRTDIERPRTEWVFQCPHGHLQWEEPEAAKALWREKCPQIQFDVVTLDGGGTSWERRRNGNLVPLLGENFATKFPGRRDLEEIPIGIN